MTAWQSLPLRSRLQISLLETANGRDVEVRPLSELSNLKHITNLSPHALIGGVSRPLRKRAGAYFLRALLRKFKIYVLNEYDLADLLLKSLYAQIDYTTILANPNINQFVICPDTSLKEKSFSQKEIRMLIGLINEANENATIDIISDQKLEPTGKARQTFKPRSQDYSYPKTSIFICADSALLHYFHGEGFRVIMVAKTKPLSYFHGQNTRPPHGCTEQLVAFRHPFNGDCRPKVCF